MLNEIPKKSREIMAKDISKLLIESKEEGFLVFSCKQTAKGIVDVKVMTNLNSTEAVGMVERTKLSMLMNDLEQPEEENKSRSFVR
jgi:hypothetical protein